MLRPRVSHQFLIYFYNIYILTCSSCCIHMITATCWQETKSEIVFQKNPIDSSSWAAIQTDHGLLSVIDGGIMQCFNSSLQHEAAAGSISTFQAGLLHPEQEIIICSLNTSCVCFFVVVEHHECLWWFHKYSGSFNRRKILCWTSFAIRINLNRHKLYFMSKL